MEEFASQIGTTQLKLSAAQISPLLRVRMDLDGEDLKVMNSILIQFAFPGSY